jgi:hypothetical protein
MAELHIETSLLLSLNILLLFLVTIEPFLFNLIGHSSGDFAQNISILYAVDLGGLFLVQALIAHSVLSDKTKTPHTIQTFKIRRNTLLISATFFFVSTIPIFWVWSIPISSDNAVPLRIILWLIPLFMPTVRRLWERKTNIKLKLI